MELFTFVERAFLHQMSMSVIICCFFHCIQEFLKGGYRSIEFKKRQGSDFCQKAPDAGDESPELETFNVVESTFLFSTKNWRILYLFGILFNTFLKHDSQKSG